MRIGILLFNDVEELDFAGPLEVFGVAARIAGGIDVCTVSKTGDLIRCRYGLHVQPDHSFANCPELDLLIVPGGKGAREDARYDEDTLEFVRGHARRAPIASICTGALVLAEAGLLQGRKATTHWSAIDLLRAYPEVRVLDDVRFVHEDDVATSAGVSAGIDLALEIVRKRFGPGVAQQVARTMEYLPAHADLA